MFSSTTKLWGEKFILAKMGMLPKNPQKLIVFVHGGPKERDYGNFNAINAWLTNRNYALLQVFANI